MNGDRYNTRAEPFVYAVKYTMIRALLLTHDVLVDDTHTTEGSIRKLLEIDPQAEFIFIDTNPFLCMERARKTEPRLQPIIVRHHDNLKKLTGAEDMSEISEKLPGVIDKLREGITPEVLIKT